MGDGGAGARESGWGGGSMAQMVWRRGEEQRGEGIAGRNTDDELFLVDCRHWEQGQRRPRPRQDR